MIWRLCDRCGEVDPDDRFHHTDLGYEHMDCALGRVA